MTTLPRGSTAVIEDIVRDFPRDFHSITGQEFEAEIEIIPQERVPESSSLRTGITAGDYERALWKKDTIRIMKSNPEVVAYSLAYHAGTHAKPHFVGPFGHTFHQIAQEEVKSHLFQQLFSKRVREESPCYVDPYFWDEEKRYEKFRHKYPATHGFWRPIAEQLAEAHDFRTAVQKIPSLVRSLYRK